MSAACVHMCECGCQREVNMTCNSVNWPETDMESMGKIPGTMIGF